MRVLERHSPLASIQTYSARTLSSGKGKASYLAITAGSKEDIPVLVLNSSAPRAVCWRAAKLAGAKAVTVDAERRRIALVNFILDFLLVVDVVKSAVEKYFFVASDIIIFVLYSYVDFKINPYVKKTSEFCLRTCLTRQFCNCLLTTHLVSVKNCTTTSITTRVLVVVVVVVVVVVPGAGSNYCCSY